jgi:hypothetical protein
MLCLHLVCVFGLQRFDIHHSIKEDALIENLLKFEVISLGMEMNYG